jgi:hypothetical protein
LYFLNRSLLKTKEMRLSPIFIHHDTPMDEPVPPRARRFAGVEDMVALQRTLLGVLTDVHKVQEELLKVEGKRLALEKLALEKDTFFMEKRRRREH